MLWRKFCHNDTSPMSNGLHCSPTHAEKFGDLSLGESFMPEKLLDGLDYRIFNQIFLRSLDKVLCI